MDLNDRECEGEELSNIGFQACLEEKELDGIQTILGGAAGRPAMNMSIFVPSDWRINVT